MNLEASKISKKAVKIAKKASKKQSKKSRGYEKSFLLLKIDNFDANFSNFASFLMLFLIARLSSFGSLV